MFKFNYIDILSEIVRSQYSSAEIVYSTSGTELRVAPQNYAEFVLEKQYTGRHIKIVLKNESGAAGRYTLGISNKLTLNSAVAVGEIAAGELKVIIMPCPLNFNVISYSATAQISVIGIFVAVAEFDNEMKLLTPESFKIMNLLSRNYISASSDVAVGTAFLLKEGQYTCKAAAKYEDSHRLALQITSKKVNVYFGSEAFCIQGAASLCLDMPVSAMDVVLNPYSLTSLVPSLLSDNAINTAYVRSNIPIWTLENHAENTKT